MPATRTDAAGGDRARVGAGPLFVHRSEAVGVDARSLDYLFAEDEKRTRRERAQNEVRQALDEAEALNPPPDAGTDAGSVPPRIPPPVAPADARIEARIEARELLAAKLCRLLADLGPDGRDRATGAALRALEQLANDQVVRVRVALASAIKDVALAPPSVINTLARDVERAVAEPILRYCAGLTDADLIALITERDESWALCAIAGRKRVSGRVAGALGQRGDPAATGVLLDNDGAVIPEPMLARLIDESPDHPEWQGSLARRPGLPRRLANRLGMLVDRSILAMLRRRQDFDDQTTREIAAVARRRLDWEEGQDPDEPASARARRFHKMRGLDEAAIGDALSWGDTDFAREAIALLAKVPPAIAGAILASDEPRAITALCWRAGLSMRCAILVQTRAGGIPPPRLINARRGTDYPLTPAQMVEALAPYGLG